MVVDNTLMFWCACCFWEICDSCGWLCSNESFMMCAVICVISLANVNQI